MTEAEWLACDDPEPMRQFVTFTNRQPWRKAVLWFAACFTLADRHSTGNKVAVLEKFADGEVSHREFERSGVSARWVKRFPILMGPHYRTHHASFTALLREVIGNPFHQVALDPAVRTPPVVSLARVAYDERTLPSGHLDPARLAVLSDALEEAGCTDADVLSHLRSPGPHVRGCWALDLILAK